MTANETSFRAKLLQDILVRLRAVTSDPAVLEAATASVIGFSVDDELSKEDVNRKRVDEQVTHQHAAEVLTSIGDALYADREPRSKLDMGATNNFLGLLLGRRVTHIGTRDREGWRGWTIGFEGGTVLGYGQPNDPDAPVYFRAAMLSDEEHGRRALKVISEKKA